MKSTTKTLLFTMLCLLATLTSHAAPMLEIQALQRYPWNGMVDLVCHVSNPYGACFQSLTAIDEASGAIFPAHTLLTMTGEPVEEGYFLPSGKSVIVWNAAADLPKGWQSDRMTLTGNIRNYQTVSFGTTTYSSDGTKAILSATASSGNEVVFEIISGAGTVSGNTLSFTGTEVAVRAVQPGDGDWMPAAVTNKLVAQYVVVNLAGGSGASQYSVSYLVAAPSGGLNTDAYKKNLLVLRRIEAGTFTMGSPVGEVGKATTWANTDFLETQHKVTLTKSFYIGVFEVTQTQWRQVTGQATTTNAMMPAYSNSYSTVPFYGAIRGTNSGAKWPASNAVDAGSFMGKLRSKTGVAFDLPTEAQWEYACRAGTTTGLNSGKNLTDRQACPNMAEVGRYYWNGGGYGSHFLAVVGSYKPNAWGLYDMHGNAGELCLDWAQLNLGSNAVTDPMGPRSANSEAGRIIRGGSSVCLAHLCRSASRGNYSMCPNGFRVACPAQ